jgi:hypothetical protein
MQVVAVLELMLAELVELVVQVVVVLAEMVVQV